MPLNIPERITAARAGTNPTVICRVSSGWVVLSDQQFLTGYCILLAEPTVPSLNDLSQAERAIFLADMAVIGDALQEVTGAYRINYAILGNSDPYLHAHIIPRYLTEPDDLRQTLPWFYPQSEQASKVFDAQRDKALMQRLSQAIRSRL